MTRSLAGAAFALLVAAALPGPAQAAPAAPAAAIDITVHRIPSFDIGDPEIDRFGALRWRGGLELESSSRRLGGLSGLVVEPGGDSLLAITDDGQMLRAAVERDADGRPIGLGGAAMRGMEAVEGGAFGTKFEADTESLDVLRTPAGPVAYVSFEARPAVMRGPVGADGFIGPLEPIRLPPAIADLRFTKGLESLAVPPAGHPLAGAVVVIAERAIRGTETDDRPGWIVGGPSPGAFHVVDDGYDITDAKFGPDGDLFILQRLFNLADGVRARVGRIALADLRDGAEVRPETIMEATLAHQIDNMEGLAIWTDPQGRTILSLLSDDNRSFLQRNLYLEFELVD